MRPRPHHRPIRRLATIGLAVLTAAAVVPTSVSAAPVTPSDAPAPPTIADVLLSDAAGDDAEGFDRNWRDYDIVTQAVLLFPDLVEAASDPEAALTVLAPNDAAFRTLATKFAKRHLRTEAEVFGVIASLGLETVGAVLRYHIVPAALAPADVLASNRVQVPTLLEGATFTVRVRNPRLVFVQFRDNDPNSADPSLNRINIGGVLDNGYIHGIDRVLRPIDL